MAHPCEAPRVELDTSVYAALFPADVIVSAADPSALALEGSLYPEEEAQIARAVPKRRAEYAAARLLARRGLERLGLSPAPIVNDAERVPRFPEGVVGGISHTAGLCVVALARAERYLALGVDVEGSGPLSERLFETVLRPEERAALSGLPEEARGRLAKQIFCVKECAYKAQYPLSRRYFGFDGMRVHIDEGRFSATLALDAGPFASGHEFTGRLVAGERFVASAVALAHEPRPK